MADPGLQMVHPHFRRQSAAQIVRRLGLADAGNVVALAFDRHQGGAGDRGRIDRARRDG